MKAHLFAAAFAFFALVSSSAAKQGSDIQTKIAIEKNLEERLHRILTEIIGTDKLIIVINAQLVGSSDGEEEEEEVVLPGVPLQEKLGLGLAGLELGDTAKKIKKLSAQIIIDNGLPEPMLKIIKEVSSAVLGMDTGRGDILTIKKMNFRKNPFSWSDIIYPPHLWGLLFTVLFAAGMAAFFVFVLRTFPGAAESVSQAVRETGEQNTSAHGGFSSGAGAASLLSASGPSAAVSGSGETASAGHFSFVTPGTVDKILFLLKKEKPENIAILLNYAPDVSGIILSGLDKKLAGDVLSRLTYTRSLSAEDVTKWENELRLKLDFFVGGKDIVSDILGNLSDEDTDEYISLIGEGDSSFAEELRKSVFKVAQLSQMSPENLLLIYQNFNPVSFADVLRELPEDIRKKVLDKFPQGISSRLNEEIDLAASPGAQKLLAERKALSRLVSRLKKDGLLGAATTEA
ncbi:MAG: FliG C-terminal domain-containing protein [Elusimicrobiota bacterium]|nr:FliG C-terminal domain-containing protein [Elusimicrobiota bacterium]